MQVCALDICVMRDAKAVWYVHWRAVWHLVNPRRSFAVGSKKMGKPILRLIFMKPARGSEFKIAKVMGN